MKNKKFIEEPRSILEKAAAWDLYHLTKSQKFRAAFSSISESIQSSLRFLQKEGRDYKVLTKPSKGFVIERRDWDGSGLVVWGWSYCEAGRLAYEFHLDWGKADAISRARTYSIHKKGGYATKKMTGVLTELFEAFHPPEVTEQYSSIKDPETEEEQEKYVFQILDFLKKHGKTDGWKIHKGLKTKSTPGFFQNVMSTLMHQGLVKSSLVDYDGNDITREENHQRETNKFFETIVCFELGSTKLKYL